MDIRSADRHRSSRYRQSLGWLASLLGATFVVIGFFEPWMDGANAFGLRTFSGFDFARLIRNFEITADSVPAASQIRVTAIAIYLMPALAVNAAFLYQLSMFARSLHYAASVALLSAAVYIVSMLSALLFLSVVPINQFADVVGPPSWGFALTLLAALMLGWLGQIEMRKARRPSADSG